MKTERMVEFLRDIEENARDAKRYRWLRELRPKSAHVIVCWGAGAGVNPAFLDESIDSAMEEE